MSRRWKVIFLLGAVIVIGLIGFQLSRLLLNRKSENEITALVPVRTGAPTFGEIEDILSYPGNLLPERTIGVVSEVPGKVEQIYVQEGDSVNQNQILLSVEKDIVTLELEQAKAGYTVADAQYRQAVRGAREEELSNAKALLVQAEKDLKIAQTNFERTKGLLESGITSQAKFEEVRSIYQNAETEVENARRSVHLMESGASEEELDIAGANVEAMKAKYEMAQIQYNNSNIKAPGSGIVAKIMTEEGNMVGEGTPVMAIVQDDPIYAEVPIPEKYYGIFSKQQASILSRIKPIAYPDHTPFTGEITSVAAVIDGTTRTFAVEIGMKNTEKLLRPGMYVNVELVLRKSENALLIPESSLVVRDDKQVVFTILQGGSYHAEQVPVTVGLRRNGYAEIISGLSGNETIIIEGNAFLEDGQEVDPINL